MKSFEVRKKYIEFFVKRGHKEIPSAPLVPLNDPTTLFNSSGMQPLVPYLLGEPHPLGKRLVNSQKAIRLQDIDEVGDNRHTTFFEMLGNWSLGDYFKKEQLEYILTFLTDRHEGLGLPKEKLYVSLFKGNNEIPRDNISYEKWLELGIPKNHIFEYDVNKNWWSRSGSPNEMPPGEPGGPSSEIFYEFTKVTHDPKFGDKCHPNCDCGRFLEIGNSVFMQYKKLANGNLEELPNKNVDFGGGLERLVAATNDDPDVFKIDIFKPLVEKLIFYTKVSYGEDAEIDRRIRIIADHIRSSAFLIKDGILPSNKLQGYILRRLIRRAALKLRELSRKVDLSLIHSLTSKIVGLYEHSGYFEYKDKHDEIWIADIVFEEIKRFERSLDKGLKEFEKYEINQLNALNGFNLYQTYGFPPDLIKEMYLKRGVTLNEDEFKGIQKKHAELSRSISSSLFKGGLADQSVETTRLHTAHHLLLAALQKVVDPSIKQRGSNITAERLRIDFNFNRALTDSEKKKIEELVNEKIQESLEVKRVEMKKADAENLGAQMEFGAKYPDIVSVYFVGLNSNSKLEEATPADYFSAEFCGGPHVANTSEIGEGGKKFKISKEESVGSGIRRIKAVMV